MKAIFTKENYREINKKNIVEPIKINDWLYILDEVNSIRMYLILGTEKALLFDAGFGFSDFRDIISGITNLPLTVVCSHGHDDHVLGCFQFESAYIAEADYELCLSNDNDEQRKKQIASRRTKTPNIDEIIDLDAYLRTTIKNCDFKFMRTGDVFDLGGITLQVYPIPGHTKGSITLYCKEKKALFSGDAMMKNHALVYAQSLDVSSEPQLFIRALTCLANLEIDTVWPAHGDVPAGKELIEETRNMLIEWANNADPENDKSKMPANPIFAKPGSFVYKYKYKNLTLNYNPGHLDQIHEFMKQNNGAVE